MPHHFIASFTDCSFGAECRFHHDGSAASSTRSKLDGMVVSLSEWPENACSAEGFQSVGKLDGMVVSLSEWPENA
jgi:hypothetical protein